MTGRIRLKKHLVYAAIVVLAAYIGRWDWIGQYLPLLVRGIGITMLFLVASSAIGFLLAVLLGLAQVAGPAVVSWPARAFCTFIRGTPLLLQLWMLYYGLGALFAQFPEVRGSFAWPYLRTAWPYGLTALTLSYAGYAGEVMRGALANVPSGELEAARAFGMGRRTALRRVWLPRAVQRALPTLVGETILQLKATPLLATITIIDVYAAVSRVRQDTYLTYEPLLLLAAIYVLLTAGLSALLNIPGRRRTVR
ncbi:polar amino acid transport system permease protein [Rhizobium sp. BK650]|uniref:ABC transporter permease n=1 Tax=Rhizobium sp. BK650 TaxID=2586990 RepID=UPI001796675B|nr:ABC transporter permease subunit [Rhizobium sp. BK650]MBB3660054.1 polar amino acid transport system permease protein [Rhizobium sp. BK650]